MSYFIFDFIDLKNIVATLCIWAIISFYYKMKFESWTVDKIITYEKSLQELKNEISDLKDSHTCLTEELEIIKDSLISDESKIQELVDMGYPDDIAFEYVKFNDQEKLLDK